MKRKPLLATKEYQKTITMNNPVNDPCPLNQEHIEAKQDRADQYRRNFMNSLGLEDQNKFKVVDDACKILVDAGIVFYLFPFLPSAENPKVNSMWQWNSLDKIAINENGEIDKKLIGQANESLIFTVYNLYYPTFKGDTHFQSLQNYSILISECHSNEYHRMRKQEEL